MLASIGKFILEWLGSKLFEFIGYVWGLYKVDKSNKETNETLKEKLEKSETDQEQQDATNDLADRLRGKR